MQDNYKGIKVGDIVKFKHYNSYLTGVVDQLDYSKNGIPCGLLIKRYHKTNSNTQELLHFKSIRYYWDEKQGEIEVLTRTIKLKKILSNIYDTTRIS